MKAKKKKTVPFHPAQQLSLVEFDLHYFLSTGFKVIPFLTLSFSWSGSWCFADASIYPNWPMMKKLILNDSIFITNRVSVFKNSLTKFSPLLTIVLKLVEGGCLLGTCTLRMLVLLRDVIFSGLSFLLKSISNWSYW